MISAFSETRIRAPTQRPAYRVAAVREIGCHLCGTKRVASDFLGDTGESGTLADHPPRIWLNSCRFLPTLNLFNLPLTIP